MIKNMFKNILLICLFAIPVTVFAQTNTTINRNDLLDKTWFFVVTKCPDKVDNGTEAHYIRHSFDLMMSATNVNNINYGVYTKTYKDRRDNPVEKGTYSITNDDGGNVILTLKKAKSTETSIYSVAMVESNHLTLIRTDGKEKCNIFYAVAP